MEAQHILIVYGGKIPTPKYGGISRVIWHLGKELVRMGHRVTFDHAEHIIAQERGRELWYLEYKTRIVKVERDYEWNQEQ